MPRLIDADEAKENACKWECGGDPSCPYSKSNGITHEQCEFMRAIDECRTIDAAPVVHGHWIGWSGEKMVDYYNETYKKIHGYRCSNCNRNTSVKSKYCSCCGALMDEVTNNGQTN